MSGTTQTVLIVGGLVGVAAIAYFMMNRPAQATTIIRTVPTGTSSTALTAAEIAAGAGLATTLANDIFGDDGS